ncbi:MAG: cytochrome c biogenesis protein ResB [Isosphaeraceae bacterium]
MKHFGLSGLPMFPNVIPSARNPGEAPPKALVSISYDPAPALDPKSNGRFGTVEVMGTSDGSLFYRVYGRGENGKTRGQIRSKGPLKKGQEQLAFGGNPGMPMTLSFVVDDYLTAGVEKEICEPAILPRSQMGNGIAASLVEMTVPDAEGSSKETTREFYVRRSATFDQNWKTVTFPGGTYRIAYDVDRKPLGFELKLDDFDRGFDPGTEQASRFQSQVRLTDKAAGIVEKPITISMNEPLTHKGYTFYQASYIREEDPRTGRETGRVQSVLQVGKNPGRPIIYLGSLLIVIGSFVQFYMRAGVFTDGGKKERERAAAREAAGNGAAKAAKPRRRNEDEPL